MPEIIPFSDLAITTANADQLLLQAETLETAVQQLSFSGGTSDATLNNIDGITDALKQMSDDYRHGTLSQESLRNLLLGIVRNNEDLIARAATWSHAGWKPLQRFAKDPTAFRHILAAEKKQPIAANVAMQTNQASPDLTIKAHEGSGARHEVSRPRSVDWKRLDAVMKRVIRGDKKALREIEEMAGQGLIVEQALAIEWLLIFPEENGKKTREAALSKLREIESDFFRFWHDPNSVAAQEKRERIEPHVTAAAKIGLMLPLSEKAAVDTLFNIVQLYEFLRQLSESFHDKEEYTFYISHFLLGRVRVVEGLDAGDCFPLALLAIHLGKKIGLSLQGYSSEGHVSVYVKMRNDSFLFEPASNESIFLPPDFYELGLRAPVGQGLVSDGKFILTQALNSYSDVPTATEQRFLKSALRVFPNDYETWSVLADSFQRKGNMKGAERATDRGLQLFPNALSLIVEKVELLVWRSGDLGEVMGYLERALQVIQQRFDRSEKDTETDTEELRLAAYGQRLSDCLELLRSEMQETDPYFKAVNWGGLRLVSLMSRLPSLEK